MSNFTFQELRNKLEHYCSYQERCYKEVETKLFSLQASIEEKESILIYLIENNFLNEERFSKSFVRGKHIYKGWGKIKIINELKFRGISMKNINNALLEIDEGEYLQRFHEIAEKNWESISEKNKLKKNKKFIDFLFRKGYELDLIIDKAKELEA